MYITVIKPKTIIDFVITSSANIGDSLFHISSSSVFDFIITLEYNLEVTILMHNIRFVPSFKTIDEFGHLYKSQSYKILLKIVKGEATVFTKL